jgi:hypothetical protein
MAQTTGDSKMNEQTAIQTLKKEIKSNPAADAVFHLFAARQRARHQVTVRALFYKMSKEGFKFTKSDYAAVLKRVGQLGFGRIEYDRTGNVQALKDIKVTLQSLGEAVIRQEQVAISAYNKRNRFTQLASSVAADLRAEQPKPPKLAVVKAPEKQVVVYPYRSASTVSITLTIAGKPVILPIPGELSPEEIAALISHLRGVGGEILPKKGDKAK